MNIFTCVFVVGTSIFITGIEYLKNEASYREAFDSLPEFRKEKARKMVQERSKRECVGAWILLRKALSSWGVCLDELQVKVNAFGKPEVPDVDNLFFNFSHSGERVLCCISERSVGCDVEQIKPSRLKVARAAFSPTEYEYLEAVPEGEDRDDLFFRIWTRKESYLKAIGTGFGTEPAKITVWPQAGRMHFYEKKLDGYRFCCCAESEAEPDWNEVKDG